jgi:uncharacterized protein involved in exopolysaccharide biosynthesis
VTDSQAKSQQPALAKLAVDDEIGLLGYVRLIWHYRWMILALCIVAMSLTVVTSLRKPRQYQSTVTIVPPLDILQRESGGNLGSLNSPLLRQFMETTTGNIANMYVEILGSREVIDTITDRFHLMDVYGDMRYRSGAREQLKSNTKIQTTREGVVRIAVADVDPNRSAAIANAYVEELDKRNKRLSAGQAMSKRVFLENRLKEVEGKLSKIDNILSREAKTQEMLYELLTQQFEIAKMEEARSMPTIQVLDPAVVPELPMGRGTVKKGIMAGIATFMLAVFLAIAAQHVVRARQQETGVGTDRETVRC